MTAEDRPEPPHGVPSAGEPEGPGPAESPISEEAAIGRGAAIATAGTALSRVTGFLRLATAAYALGVTETRLHDTYNIANTTPNIVYELVLGGVLSSVLLRVYVEVRDREGQEAAWRFVTRVINLSMAVLGTIALIGIVSAPWVVSAYTFRTGTGERAAQQALATFLLRLFIPQIVFYGLSTISTAVLQAHRRFGVPMFAPVLNNLIASATFVAFALAVPAVLRDPGAVPFHGRVLLGLGTTAGVAAMGLVPWWWMRRAGWRRVRGAGFRDPAMRRLARLSAYTVGYVVTNQVGLWATVVLAFGVRGGVTAYQVAFIFFQLPHGLLAVSISTALGPGLAERGVAGDMAGFSLRLSQGLRAVAFVVLPAVAGYLAIGPEVVRVLLEHGVVTGQSTEMITAVLRGFAPGLLFFSSFHLMLRAFQALGDTRTPMLVNLGAVAVNVAVNLTVFALLDDPVQKVAGLALGHACSYLVAAGASLAILRRRLGGLHGSEIARTSLRCLAAAMLTGLGAWAVVRATAPLGAGPLPAQVAQILGATLVGLLIYAAAARAFRLEEFAWLKSLVLRRSP